MSDLIAQIRDRLDGWAPALREHGLPLDATLPAAFLVRRDDELLSPAEIEAWQKQWDEMSAGSKSAPIRVLPPGPRFYPGYEQMRDAVLAVLEFAEPGEPFPGDSRDHAEKAIDAELEATLAHVCGLIAEKLGIEVASA